MLKLRKSARKLYYRHRHLALSSNDLIKSNRIKKFLQYLMIILGSKQLTAEKRAKLQRCFRILAALYLNIVVEPERSLEPLIRRDRTIDSFSFSECFINFRFGRAELTRLFTALKFPEWVYFSNRSKMKGEEVFLRGLYELVTGENQYRTSVYVFGREGTAQSRAFAAFIRHIYNNYHHLVHDNLLWWKRNGFFRSSAEAIQEKIGNIDVNIGNCAVAHFIDCNCLPTCVVGGGPAEAGANAARWDDTIQRAFYNGWKSVHGLKHQCLWFYYLPTSLRRNDLAVLRDSNINQRMAELQADDDTDYIIFGDSAYKRMTHIMSYLAAGDNIHNHHLWNRALKKVSISIEWDYGCTATLFKYLQNTHNLKLLKSHDVANVYTVTTLLRNCHTAVYGCQTSSYFNLVIPENF